MDKFNFFCLSNKDKAYLGQYISPGGEASTFKQIPIQQLDRTKRLLKQLGYRARVVYRGPRTNQIDPSFTRKEDAVAFTVYPR
jgi:hypothetical protein